MPSSERRKVVSNKESVALLSRLPLKGASLYSLLSRYYEMFWIGERLSFSLNPFNIPYVLALEFWKLFVAYRKLRFSLILVQFVSLDGLAALLFKRMFGVKLVLFAMGSDIFKLNEHPFAYPLIREVLWDSDLTFCANTAIAATLKHICPKASQIEVVPGIVEMNGFSDYHGSKEYDIITIGTLDTNKNHLLLLNSCRLLSRRIKVLIVGDGYLHETLAKTSREYGLNVAFSGEIPHSQVLKHLRKSRIYVHVSRREGLPVAVLEAMFFGLPVILVASPYIYDVQHRYGFLVHVVNGSCERELAGEISRVIRDYENEKRKASLNRKRVLEMISEAPTEIKKLLDQVIEQKRG